MVRIKREPALQRISEESTDIATSSMQPSSSSDDSSLKSLPRFSAASDIYVSSSDSGDEMNDTSTSSSSSIGSLDLARRENRNEKQRDGTPVRRSPRLAAKVKKIPLKPLTIKKLSIPKATFARVVKEITQDLNVDLNWTKEGVEALQTATEDEMVTYFHKLSLMALVSGRKTITLQDSRCYRIAKMT